jgi:endoglucanase
MKQNKKNVKQDAEFLKEITLLSGVSGQEKLVREYMRKQLGKIADKELRDNLGSIAFEFKGSSKAPKVMLCGHMDEVGFMVHSVNKSGLINFTNLGGWDPRTLMSSPVEIINRDGEKIVGLISSVPVHFLKDTSAKLTLDDMYIDIGAENEEEVKKLFKVNKGDFIVPLPHFHYIEKKNCIVSKAFDDRVGVAVAIETGKYFHDKKHPNTLYCAGSVQEEVGTRGAVTVSQLVKPDVAIVLEGAPGDDFPSNKEESQAAMNKGVQIRMLDPTMLCNPELAKWTIALAEKLKIPYQIAVRKTGGTDAGKIHLTDLGVPTIVLSAPVRYAHSHNGILSLKDYQAMKELTIAMVERLDTKALDKIKS